MEEENTINDNNLVDILKSIKEYKPNFGKKFFEHNKYSWSIKVIYYNNNVDYVKSGSDEIPDDYLEFILL